MFDELLFFFFPTKIELSYKVKNRDTLLKYPYVLSIYLIALYSLSYSEFFVFPQPRSNATTTVTFLTSSFSL